MDDREGGKGDRLYQTDLERHFFELEASEKGSEAEGGIGERLRVRLEQLPELYREIVMLREKEGLPYGEIAERLGLPLGTVKSRLHRARAALRRLLDELEEQIEAAKADEPARENSEG